jgi:death-on-curing protein
VNDPLFLTLDEVLQIHAYQIEEFGGSDKILDMGLLESAIAQPRQGFGGKYLHPSLAQMAAAYLFHIVQNHAFEDGNKRTGTHAAIVFLAMNGQDLGELPESAEALVLSVAKSEASKDDVVTFFESIME